MTIDVKVFDTGYFDGKAQEDYKMHFAIGETTARVELNYDNPNVFRNQYFSSSYISQLYGYVIIPDDPDLTTHNQSVQSDSASNKVAGLSHDLCQMMCNPDSYSDATLKCGVSEIPVHKCILTARSPVFAAMFKNRMKEGRSGVVDIVDLNPDVLRAMLEYVYGDKTDNLTDVLAGDLLFAADKYQLEGLKSTCVMKLKSCTTRDNVFRVLVLGEMHDKSLKDHAKDFVCKCGRFSELESTKEWASLQEENPRLAMEVMSCVLKHVQEK